MVCARLLAVLLAAVSCGKDGGRHRRNGAAGGIHYVKSVKSVCELFGAVSESKAVFRYDDARRLSRIDVTDEDGSYAVGYAWEETKLTVTTDYGDGEASGGYASRWTVPVG